MCVVATVCSWNTNVIIVWAWMLWQPYALGTRTLSWFGQGCSGNPMLLEHERYYALGMGAVATVCSGTRTLSCFGHGCSGNPMLLEHERYHGLGMDALWQPYALGTRTLSWFGHGRSGNRNLLEHERYHGLGMDALATVCSWNTNVILV